MIKIWVESARFNTNQTLAEKQERFLKKGSFTDQKILEI